MALLGGRAFTLFFHEGEKIRGKKFDILKQKLPIIEVLRLVALLCLPLPDM